jgi:hypothetical protein
MMLNRPLMETLPPPHAVRDRLGDAMREVELLRRLLRLAERAAMYRELDQSIRVRREASHAS